MDSEHCGWVGLNDPIYADYHDTEWGVPEYDSRALWEKLMLDGFQAGLAWITILRKRGTLREAFHGFDPEIIAGYDKVDHARLMADPGIIRSNAKIQAAIGNARAYLDMREAGVDFSDYLWGYVGGTPIQNSYNRETGLPTHTELSTALSKDLKKRGFKFVGPVIVYAFMEAVGCVPFFLNRAMTFIAARVLPAKVPAEGLPARLYHRRRELRLTKVEVAKIIGVTPGIIRRWEEAEHPPSAKHVPAMVAFLGDDDWIEATTLGEKVKRFRLLQGWSQLQMSRHLDCAEGSVRSVERGTRPSRKMRNKVKNQLCNDAG